MPKKKKKKKDFTKSGNTFLEHKNDFNRQNFIRNRTKCNRIKNKANRLHKINEGRTLNDEARNQPRKFWKKKIKSYRKQKSTTAENLNMEDLLEHFQNMYSGNSDTQTINDDIPLNETADPDLNSNISLEELKQAIVHQKINKKNKK